MRPIDLLTLANACYTLENDERVWLQNIVDVLRPWLDRGLGIAAWSFCVGDWKCVHPPIGVDGALADALCAVGHAAAPALKSRFFLGARAQPCCARLGNRTGLDRDLAFAPLWPFRIRDFHVLTLLDAMGTGLAFLAPEFHVISSDTAMARRLERVGTHVLAGFRLRRALAQLEARVAVNGVASAQVTARRALRRAVKVFDRLSSRRGLEDWDAALEAWQGLVAGRWSLVQSFESQGRRYLVARRNPTATGSSPQSSASNALRLRAEGASYKYIAGELGISIACAHQLVKGACQRLGIRDESELPHVLSVMGWESGEVDTRRAQL